MKPTPEQQRAIDFDEGKCLVAAGAGSGKTKVLTSRIFELVTTGKAKLSELLVLTFTNKAAHEMKMRVRALFEESGKFSHLVGEVEVAKIMTFDAFALDLVKRYRYQLGLDKGIDLYDSCFFAIKTDELLDEALARHYEMANKGQDEAFRTLVLSGNATDDGDFKAFIKKILDIANKKTNRREFLQKDCKTLLDEPHLQALMGDLESQIRKAYRAYYDELSYLPEAEEYCQKDFQRIDEALATGSYDDLCEVMSATFPIIKRGAEEDFKEARNELKKKYIAPYGLYLKKKKNEWLDPLRESRRYVDTCLEIALEVQDRLDAYKKEKGIYDFADIALLARQIVSSPYGEEIKAQFKYVMVDEYQDTSDLQEDFLLALGVPNVFMVGDIKQSIYGFRNANPSLFAEKYEKYSRGVEGTLIPLDKNFRSREPVLKAINDVFSAIMSEKLGGIDYGHGQALDYGNKSYEESKDAEPYGYEVIEFEKSRYKEEEKVGYLIGRDILRRIASHYQVQDKHGTRDIRFGDFAILSRNTRQLKAAEKALRSLNIPVNVSIDRNGFDEDVMIALSTLLLWLAMEREGSALPEKVVHYNVALRRSFLFAEADQTIFRIKEEIPNDDLSKKVKDFAFSHQDEPLGEFIEKAIDEFGFLEAILRLGEVKDNFNLLSYFVDLAKKASHIGMGLSEFALFLKKRAELKLELPLSSGLESEDAVSLMTIHKSKGLEFPFVYCARFHGLFRNISNDGAKGFYVSPDYGIILPDFRRDNVPLLTSYLYKEKTKYEQKSEEMRLLYVALTRPREAFAVLIPKKEGEVKPSNGPFSARSYEGFLKASSFFDVPSVDGDALPYIPVSASKKISQKELAFPAALEQARLGEERSEEASLPELISPGALRHGLRLHRYMEVVDLASKDLSFIASPSEKEKISRVLALPIFANKEKRKAYREFAFIDEEGKEGRIDLFFVYEDHIEVIDYKSLHIEKDEYKEQVRRYMNHLAKVFGLPVRGYLLSLGEATLIEVQ